MDKCNIEGCEVDGKYRGWCKRHYDRWYRTGSPEFPAPKSATARLLERARLQDECLVWNGPTADPNGRGSVRYKGRTWRAHQVIWMEANGPIPDGLVIRHTCDVMACLNIEHMLIGTQRENMHDMKLRQRGRWKVCRNGLHRLEGENLYILPSNPAYRECRACRNERNRRYHDRQKS